MKLQERLAALASSSIVTLVLDPERLRFLWANASGLKLWKVASLEELLSRDLSDMSAAARARLAGYIARFQEGQTAEETWTVYPGGEPVALRAFFSGVELDDGRLGILIQALRVEDTAQVALSRSVEALRHTSSMVTLLDAEGNALLHNPASLRAFGEGAPFAERFVDPEVAEALLAAASRGEVASREAAVRTSQGERWHRVEARQLPDPVTGAPAILVQHVDETGRRAAEQTAEAQARFAAELAEALETVQRQQQEILTLSAPILEVAPGTLALPVIGALDGPRSEEIAARLLRAVVERTARCIILDLTGAATATAGAAEHLAQLVRALRLLGTRPIVTGVPPALAQAFAEVGADLSGVMMLRSLRDGIRASARRAFN
ncbi:anti-anti sigma factor protein [Sorangium cellulosum]|uniref:Anti-anti sigma factor protein n=1 Tax=Sorangium cellulosum TaxID=56 RepID=A0A2L0FB92_SORCE|nr:PAS domain-containing protein [Sorangium cellulosum]AUX48793.1 anti-anti sigma factor protein [Sorangium cellulosum]